GRRLPGLDTPPRHRPLPLKRMPARLPDQQDGFVPAHDGADEYVYAHRLSRSCSSRLTRSVTLPTSAPRFGAPETACRLRLRPCTRTWRSLFRSVEYACSRDVRRDTEDVTFPEGIKKGEARQCSTPTIGKHGRDGAKARPPARHGTSRRSVVTLAAPTAGHP